MTVPQVIYLEPPADLLAPTPEPSAAGCRTNADLLRIYLDTRKALRSCNADKAAAARAIAIQKEASK